MNILMVVLIFYTRLPFTKYFRVSSHYFKDIVHYWVLAGWVTAPITALILLIGYYLFPYQVAIILALMGRLLVTGALHEDGLADFVDGFGGGYTQEAILRIMKDSHIGTYGVLTLIFYFFLMFSILLALPIKVACVLILVADPLCKGLASFIALFLPYVRHLEESKFQMLLNPMNNQSSVFILFFMLLPLFIIMPWVYWILIIPPVILFFSLIVLMKNKIGGYTGDCAGALFLLLEITSYLSFLGLFTFYGSIFGSTYFG